MSIVITGLTSGTNTTDATSYSSFTASITPTANYLQILCVKSRTASGEPNAPTVTGCNLTWVAIGSANASPPATNHKITFFRALGASPTTGQLTCDFAGQTQTHIIWSWSEASGMSTAGTDGSGAIVAGSFTELGQNHASGVDPFILTLPAFANSSNAAFGAQAGFTTVNIGVGAGFTELHDVPLTDGASTNSFQSEWAINDNTISWDLDDANKNSIAGGFEISIPTSTQANNMCLMGVT